MEAEARVPFDHAIETTALRSGQFLSDGLGRGPVARLLADRLLAHPGVVGVYGSWGSGKSFLLDLTIKQLFTDPAARRRRPIVCYFQPWRCEPDTSLAPGLIKALGEVPDQFPGLNPSFRADDTGALRQAATMQMRATRQIVGVLGPVAHVAAAAMAPMPATPVTIPVKASVAVVDTAAQVVRADRAPDPVADWNPDEVKDRMRDLIQGLRESAVAAAPEGDSWRSADDYWVVIVIDDLDRCAPDLMVEMLNWLKVHLTVPGCAFLLALDHGAAARAIVGKYRSYLGENADVAYGLRYLEKIVDFEVELGESRLVEQMAARAVGQADSATEIIAGLIRRQGVRSVETGKLMRLPTLQSPRTMLKVLSRYTGALREVEQDHSKRIDARSEMRQLPTDYSFWLLLLVTMYYRLAPWQIEAFCRGEGPLVTPAERTRRSPDTSGDPLGEFQGFLDAELKASSGSSSQPVPAVMLYLYAVVRQLSVPAE